MTQQEILNRIGMLRTRANLSARELSLRIGKNASYINGIEKRKNFLPPLEVLLEIIVVCGSTPCEFFYDNIRDYAADKEIISLLKVTNSERKAIVLDMLKVR